MHKRSPSKHELWLPMIVLFWSISQALKITFITINTLVIVKFGCFNICFCSLVRNDLKKRNYQQRVPDVEMGSFTHLVFGTIGGMGADCNCFLKRLAEKLSEKNEEPYHITITWIKALLFLRF